MQHDVGHAGEADKEPGGGRKPGEPLGEEPHQRRRRAPGRDAAGEEQAGALHDAVGRQRDDDGRHAEQHHADTVKEPDADTDRQHQRYRPVGWPVHPVAERGQHDAGKGQRVWHREIEPAG